MNPIKTKVYSNPKKRPISMLETCVRDGICCWQAWVVDESFEFYRLKNVSNITVDNVVCKYYDLNVVSNAHFCIEVYGLMKTRNVYADFIVQFCIVSVFFEVDFSWWR